ncbi:MAG: exodeoxyribonuclease VII small subunit [Clostridia bacterium]|nr:exodeoxyribonuclease VII small subunit [Clostridia bacterium]
MGAKKKARFEDALTRLEKIVADLDRGDLPLDDALKLFSEGAELARECNAVLDEASGKLQVLLESEDGTTEITAAHDLDMLSEEDGE